MGVLQLMLGTHTGSNAIPAEVESMENKNIELSNKKSTLKSGTALSHIRYGQPLIKEQ